LIQIFIFEVESGNGGLDANIVWLTFQCSSVKLQRLFTISRHFIKSGCNHVGSDVVRLFFDGTCVRSLGLPVHFALCKIIPLVDQELGIIRIDPYGFIQNGFSFFKFTFTIVEIEKNEMWFDVFGIYLSGFDKVLFCRSELSLLGKYAGKPHVCTCLFRIELNNFAKHTLGFIQFIVQVKNSCI